MFSAQQWNWPASLLQHMFLLSEWALSWGLWKGGLVLELCIVLMGHVSIIQLIILFMSGVTMTSTNQSNRASLPEWVPRASLKAWQAAVWGKKHRPCYCCRASLLAVVPVLLFPFIASAFFSWWPLQWTTATFFGSYTASICLSHFHLFILCSRHAFPSK